MPFWMIGTEIAASLNDLLTLDDKEWIKTLMNGSRVYDWWYRTDMQGKKQGKNVFRDVIQAVELCV